MIRTLPALIRPLTVLSRSAPALLLVLLAIACGDKEPPAKAGLPATFCTDGNKLCIGNVVATCSQAGTAYAVAACSESQYCAAGTCQAPLICEKAALSCDGSKKNQLKCPDDGSTDPGVVQACANGCMNGACLPKTCKDNEVMCGWRGVLTCKNNAWTFSKCASDELCDATAHCAKRTCAPNAIQCKSATVAQRCSVVGDKWLDQPCGDGNGCFDGVCHTIVASSVAVDAGSTSDTGPAEDVGTSTAKDGHSFADSGKKDVQLEQNDILKFVVSETAAPGSTPAVELDLASVTWNDGLKMLQISGTQGLNKFELQLAKIEEFQTGDFSAAGGEAPDTVFYFNDGTTVDPKVQWKYGSTDYEVHLESFGGAGDRVIGTFAAVMADAENAGKKIYFVEGVFDIGRK